MPDCRVLKLLAEVTEAPEAASRPPLRLTVQIENIEIEEVRSGGGCWRHGGGANK